MTFAETSGPGNDDISHGALLDDPTQKKLLGQKATPPPSPLLSELLKKGSILATNSRLVRKILNLVRTGGVSMFVGSFVKLLLCSESL